jgi:integrase/recombinase XerD
MAAITPCLSRSINACGELLVRVGVPVLDEYLRFVAARAWPNTVLATAYDLAVFFRVVCVAPAEVSSADVLRFITAQRTGSDGRGLRVVSDGAGLSARTVRRRLSSVSGLFAYLLARGDVTINPVPRGLPTRRERQRPRQRVPLVRTPRTLPQILAPGEVDRLLAALRTHRDRAMVLAMVLGGLWRCEVLGLRCEDLRVAARRVFIAEGKGGHQRLIPVSSRFFDAVAAYLDAERPADVSTERVFVVLKGPRRTGGIVGLVKKLVQAGCRHAIETGLEQITIDVLDTLTLSPADLPDLDPDAGELPHIPASAAARPSRSAKPRNTVFDDRGAPASESAS